MADGFTVDNSDFSRQSAFLGTVAATAGRFLRSAVEVSSIKNKNDWRDESKGMAHAPAFPRAIGYDITVFQGFGVSVIQSEIGPDKDRPQGALGNLIEFGSINNPPQGLGHGALQRNEADFQRGIVKALDDAERAAATGVGVAARQILG